VTFGEAVDVLGGSEEAVWRLFALMYALRLCDLTRHRTWRMYRPKKPGGSPEWARSTLVIIGPTVPALACSCLANNGDLATATCHETYAR
jgi:hypothetical protein